MSPPMRAGGNFWVRFAAAGFTLAISATILGGAGVPAGAASSGSLSGRVVDGAGDPLSGICVSVPDGVSEQTDASGTYALVGLSAGTYAVEYSDCNPFPRYLSQWYLGRTEKGTADPVEVTDAADTPLLDVTLEPGVAVSGTVTEENGNPIPNANVSVYPTSPGPSTGTQTAVDGTYTTGLLPPGAYKVQFASPAPQWAGQYWNNQLSYNAADTLVLAVSDGAVHGGVDAQLSESATIEGRVTNADGVPLSGICVDANVANGSNGYDGVGSTTTAADGTYTNGGLPAADVRIRFRECGSGPYIEQWYNAQPDFNSSTAITLTPGAVVGGVDAQLSAGISVSGSVTDANGAPIPNVNVNVNPTESGPSGWAQTDANGDYSTNGVPAGAYRVQFQGTGSFAGEFWHDQPSWSNADILNLSPDDGPVRTGIDASLATAATVSGVVTGPDGQPVANICVSANVDSSQGADWIGDTTTAPNGTYTITGLPPMAVKMHFRDCNSVGPYIEQWWNDQPDSSTATAITLAPGELRTGIDAQLAAAGEITGTVTDSDGQPLSGICAQATTTSFVGGLAHTDSNGHYAILLSKPGDYRVQFVDCNQPPTFAATWWNGQASPAVAEPVAVAAGQTVSGIDAVLTPAAVGSISGKVVSARGTAMTTACVVAYLPTQFALFGAVQPDGSYTIANVPSGTYALGFLGCNGGEPTATVSDPSVAGVTYPAVWWHGKPLDITGNGQGGPDPIAQRANLVTVTPGAQLTGYNTCFGCTAITITSITAGPNSLTIAFTAPDLISVDPARVRSASTPDGMPTYTVTCTSNRGVPAASASGPGSPITVTGLTSGAIYICRVAASINGVTVATSPSSDPTTVAGAPTPALPSVAVPTTPPSSPDMLARTGADSTVPLVRTGTLLLALGLVVIGPTRRTRRIPPEG